MGNYATFMTSFDTTAIKSLLDQHAKEIEELNLNYVGETVQVAQIVDTLSCNLAEIQRLLEDRDYTAASSLGGGETANAFVSLQRALAGLDIAENRYQKFVQDIALKSNGVYEHAEPLVKERVESKTTLKSKSKKQRSREGLVSVTVRMSAENRKSLKLFAMKNGCGLEEFCLGAINERLEQEEAEFRV